MPSTENSYPGALPKGTILNERYKILETIGRGGFGMIYRVENLINKKVYAVKEYFNLDFMHRSAQDNRSVIYEKRHTEQFGKEKKLLLSESNIVRDIGEDKSIVRIYEHFEENGTAYIVMELVEGRTLLEAVAEDGIWSPETVIRKFKPLMLTMERVHDKNVLHRDLSPDNIMVRTDGTLCILDFGSANKNTGGKKKHTKVDKANYSALELRSDSMQPGRYTDVFALCGTMYYAMTGNAPADVSGRRLEIEELVPPSKYGITISEDAERILMKGLELWPEDRTGDMETLFREFDEIYPDLTLQQQRRLLLRRRILTAAVTAAAIVFIAAGSILFWYNRNRIRLGIIASLKTTVSGENLTAPEFEDTLDTVKERFSALGGENGYVMQTREDNTAVFEVAQSSYNGIDPDWITEYLICRPLNLFLYSEETDTGRPALKGQLLQESDVDKAVPEEKGIRIDLSTAGADKFKEVLGGGKKLLLGFDTDRYELSLKLEAYADQAGSILVYRDDDHPIPDSLLINAFTHAPAASALEYACEKAVNWEEPSASLMAGKNQVGEKEIPGTATLIYYKSFFYDPKKKGEELQFQYILKNRLDSLRIPYAVGKEAFDGELYVVKVTKGALWYEEIMTLGKVLGLIPGDENGASDNLISDSEIEKDPGAGPGIAVNLDDTEREEYSQMLSGMKNNGKKSTFLYFTDYSSKLPFVSCGIDEAADTLQKEGRLFFDRFLFDGARENTASMTDIWCDYVVCSMIENPDHNYSVHDIQTMDRAGTPLIESKEAGLERLFSDPDREQVENTAAFLEENKGKADCSYRYHLTEFGKDELELILNNCDPGNINESLDRLRLILESNHLENGAFSRLSVYFKLADRGKSLYTSMKYSTQSGKMELDRFVIYGIDSDEKEDLVEAVYERISSDEYYKKLLHKEKEELFQ